MGLRNTGYQAANNLKGSGAAIVDAFKNFSPKNIFSGADIPLKSPGVIERGFLVTMKGLVGVPFKAGLRTADWGAGILAKPVAWLAAAPGVFFRAFPTGAPIITVVGGVLGIGSYITKRRSEARMNEYMQAQDAAIQAAAAQQRFTPQETFTRSQESFKNSVSPDLSAELVARQAAGSKSGGHAAALQAAQAPAASIAAL